MEKTSKAIRPSQESGSDGGSGSYVGSSWAIAIGQNVRVQSRNSIGFGSNINITNSEFSFCMGRNSNVNNSLGSTVIVQGMSIRYVPPVNLSYRGVNISNLLASSYYKGLLVTDGLAIVYSTFSKNTARFHGGALYAASGIANIYNSTFSECESIYGGAIRLSDINVYNSNFTKNNANSQGGAMYLDGVTNIYNSSFVKNTADYQGGAVYTGKTAKSANFYESTFDGNGLKNLRGYYYGGAIFEADLIRKCTFINNYAWSGGAIYQWHYHSNNRLRIENSTFNNNTALGTGGAVYAIMEQEY